jgi:hypothetical protein
MSIKSGQMDPPHGGQEHGMIEPFVEPARCARPKALTR